jgi:beta-alanine--pyruvate transaminase
MSDHFIDGVFSLKDIPGVVDIRGVGMMAAVEIAAGATPEARGHEAQKALFDANLNLKATGDSLIMGPPFIAEKSHIDEIIDKTRTTLTALSKSW